MTKRLLTTISATALDLLVHVRDVSTVLDPVITLVAETKLRPAHPDLVKAHLENADDEVMRNLIRKLESPENLSFHWKPTIVSKSALPEDCLVEISDLLFCLPPEQIVALDNGTIDTESGVLTLMDRRGSRIHPPIM